MTPFHEHAVWLIALWLVMVGVRFRRSKAVLAGGLLAVGAYTLVGLARHDVSRQDLGLVAPTSFLATGGLAVAWLVLMLVYSPWADRLATRWVERAPTLEAFRLLQQSKSHLLAGIALAWVLGAFLEELAFRGIVLRSVEALLSTALARPLAVALAVGVAAAGAGVVHLYQGVRAAVVITQLSALFGVLFVVGGYNLWAVVVCHGLYDTVAFIRFANRQSRYSRLDSG
jgi:membrane protease YdiL (CAAX protease family)